MAQAAVVPGSDSSSDAAVAPSGEQFVISWHDQEATVVEVGGGIREYRVGSRSVLDPYPLDQRCDGAHGAVLVPWPNRLRDGRYEFDGAAHQLPLSEPRTRTAIHGLVRWVNWRAIERDPARVVVGTRIHPRDGYPFALDVRIEYALDADGLTATITGRNVGGEAAPWACGFHPYLSPGNGLVDDAELQFAAATRITTDERQLPAGRAAVAGTEFDFSSPRRVGATEIDYAFCDLSRDDEGRAWTRLTGADGRRAELWCDHTFELFEIFTGDSLAPHRRRRGLGVEPMTGPPNAFASGEGLRRLEPGAQVVHRWGARLTGLDDEPA